MQLQMRSRCGQTSLLAHVRESFKAAVKGREAPGTVPWPWPAPALIPTILSALAGMWGDAVPAPLPAQPNFELQGLQGQRHWSSLSSCITASFTSQWLGWGLGRRT